MEPLNTYITCRHLLLMRLGTSPQMSPCVSNVLCALVGVWRIACACMLSRAVGPKGCQRRALWQAAPWKYLCQAVMNELTNSKVRQAHLSSPFLSNVLHPVSHLLLPLPLPLLLPLLLFPAAFWDLHWLSQSFYLHLCDLSLMQTDYTHSLSACDTCLNSISLSIYFKPLTCTWYQGWSKIFYFLMYLFDSHHFPNRALIYLVFMSSYRAEDHATRPSVLSPHSDRCQHVAWPQSTEVRPLRQHNSSLFLPTFKL